MANVTKINMRVDIYDDLKKAVEDAAKLANCEPDEWVASLLSTALREKLGNVIYPNNLEINLPD